MSLRQAVLLTCLLGWSTLLAFPVHAAEPRDPISNFLFFTSSNTVDYQGLYAPAPHSSDPSISENRARGNFIVSQTPTDTWSVHQLVDEVHLSDSPTISQTGLSVPTDLWDVDTGGAYRHHIGDRRDWGVSASVGSASDELFHSIHETTFRATAMYHMPSRSENSWLFFLSYSNNRHFANGIPFPGFAYLIHSPDDHLDAAIGLPFIAVNYHPTTRLDARFSIFGPDNVSSELSYRILKPMQVYAGFDWGQQAWLLANRPDTSQQLFYDQKKWSLGVRFPIYQEVRLDLAGVYGFDRRFYENDRAESRNIPDAELSPGWSFQGKLSTRW